MPFRANINESRAHHPPPLLGSYSLGLLFPCPNHSRPDTRQLETTPGPCRLLKLLKLTNHKPAYPIPSHKTTIKACARIFFHSFSLLTGPDASLHGPAGMACPFLLGTVRYTLSFQCQSSTGLLALPYWNNNKTFISKLFH